MFCADATYYARRALWQLDRASCAADDDIALVHARLTELYLKRALATVDGELRRDGRSNVVPMRIVA